MSEYIQQLLDIIRPEVSKYGLKIMPRGRSSFSLIRGTQIVMTVRDAGEMVELSYKGKKYNYDKWYTKPQHLANTILNVLQYQESGSAGEG
ncbi:hypothetical protein D1872_302990 [compost metagenome]